MGESVIGFSWRLVKHAGNGFVENYALRLAAALAYYSVFSIAPLLLLAIGVGGEIFGPEAVRGQVASELREYMGDVAAKGVEDMLRSAELRGDSAWAITIGAVTLLFAASGVFAQLKDALNTIWEVKTKAGRSIAAFFRDRLLSFSMVLVIGFLILVSFVITAVLAVVTDYTRTVIPVPAFFWGTVNFIVALLVSSLLFGLIFKVLPDVRLQWRSVTVGAVSAGLLFEVGKFALAFYLGRESTASGFGAAGSLVLVLLWVYYASTILLFGAELTRSYVVLRDCPVSLKAYAEPLNDRDFAKSGTQKRGDNDLITEGKQQ